MTDRQAKRAGVRAARAKYAKQLVRKKGWRVFLLMTEYSIAVFMMKKQPKVQHCELKFDTLETAYKAVEEFSKLRYRFV